MPKRRNQPRFVNEAPASQDKAQTSQVALWSLVAAILSLVVGVWAVRAGESIAERSGQFERARMRLLVAGTAAENNMDIAFAIPVAAADSSSIVIGALPIEVQNVGEKSIEDLTVTIHMPRSLQPEALDQLELARRVPTPRNEVRVDSATLGNDRYRAYAVERLNPRRAVTVQEPFKLQPTRLSLVVDTVKGVTVEASYSFLIGVVVSAKDQIPLKVTGTIGVFEADSAQARQQWSQHLVERLTQRRRAYGFMNYLGCIVRRQEAESIVLIPSFRVTTTPLGTLYDGAGWGTAIRVRYRLCQWGLLL